MTLSLVTKNFDLGVVYTCFLSIKCPKALAGRGLAPDHMHWGAIALSQNWRGEGLAAALRPTGLGFRPFMPKTTPNPMSFFDKLNTANKNLLAVTQEPGITRNQNTV